MRIKHFSGYGSVSAKKISDKTEDGINILKVEVKGDHEQGLASQYDFNNVEWLVPRFKKGTEIRPWNIRSEYLYTDNDTCVHTFILEN